MNDKQSTLTRFYDNKNLSACTHLRLHLRKHQGSIILRLELHPYRMHPNQKGNRVYANAAKHNR